MTIHHAFDELESIDMALDDPIAVGQSQANDNGRLILLNSSIKAFQFCHATTLHSCQPVSQWLGLLLMQHGHEPLGQLIDGFHVRMRLAEYLQGLMLGGS